jgi:hypothetical protein
VSPGLSCSSSRNALGNTMRPALSRVSLATMMVVYKGNLCFSEQNMPLSARLFEVQELYSTL